MNSYRSSSSSSSPTLAVRPFPFDFETEEDVENMLEVSEAASSMMLRGVVGGVGTDATTCFSTATGVGEETTTSKGEADAVRVRSDGITSEGSSDDGTTAFIPSKLSNTFSTSFTNFFLSFLTTSSPPLSSPSAAMRSFSRWWARTTGDEVEAGEASREWS
ncbi:hypothetical protein BDY24DRAFT_376000 [Mrakia frigida]|uniref:uncharacterized protein n=1 Tax=Mrakia frigida TaxID=29902 RepID=UPI003FCBF5C1